MIEPVLEAIQVISDEARRALSDPELTRDSLLTGLAVRYYFSLLLHPLLSTEYFCYSPILCLCRP